MRAGFTGFLLIFFRCISVWASSQIITFYKIRCDNISPNEFFDYIQLSLYQTTNVCSIISSVTTTNKWHHLRAAHQELKWNLEFRQFTSTWTNMAYSRSGTSFWRPNLQHVANPGCFKSQGEMLLASTVVRQTPAVSEGGRERDDRLVFASHPKFRNNSGFATCCKFGRQNELPAQGPSVGEVYLAWQEARIRPIGVWWHIATGSGSCSDLVSRYHPLQQVNVHPISLI